MSSGVLAQADDAAERVFLVARRQRRAYSNGEQRPLGSYLALMGTYAAAVTSVVVAGRASGARLPDGPRWSDLALATLATQRLSRLIAKDTVTSPVRAPFTEFEEQGGPGEVNEKVRGTGVRKAVGELLGCPFCLSQWIATGMLAGFVLAPRPTRWVASTFAVVGVSDALQFGYAKLQQAAE